MLRFVLYHDLCSQRIRSAAHGRRFEAHAPKGGSHAFGSAIRNTRDEFRHRGVQRDHVQRRLRVPVHHASARRQPTLRAAALRLLPADVRRRRRGGLGARTGRGTRLGCGARRQLPGARGPAVLPRLLCRNPLPVVRHAAEPPCLVEAHRLGNLRVRRRLHRAWRGLRHRRR